MVKVGDRMLTFQQFESYRGKFNRACKPKETSGRLDVPPEIHQTFLEKGAAKDKLFEAFVACDGNKDFWPESFGSVLRDFQKITTSNQVYTCRHTHTLIYSMCNEAYTFKGLQKHAPCPEGPVRETHHAQEVLREGVPA